MIKKLFIALILAAAPLFADQVSISKFGTLNNNSPATSIPNQSAQDLLNVDITPIGLSIKKRSGYGVYKALATGQPMHGGYHAFDSSGNDYQLWGSSTSLYGIVADGTPLQLISSATLNATWDCADTQGNSYCVNSGRDMFLRTNGTTKTWFTSPLGTMVESTPDRIVVAGVAASPNTLFVSQSNTFTNFVVGVNATDAFNEVIASPGSHLTHIRWGCGKLLWWKDASFGYFDFDDQFSAQVKTVSDIVGTFDNTSAIDPGGRVWFRGQDGHTWMYDCSVLAKQTVDITPNIQTSQKRTSNLWTQSTQAEFQTGSIVPTGQLSTTISAGDVTTSSFTIIENSSGALALGTYNNLQQNGPSNRNLSILTDNAGNVDDNSFEGGSGGTISSSWIPLLTGVTRFQSRTPTGFTCTQSAHAGSNYIGSNSGATFTSATAYLLDSVGVSTFTSTSISLESNNTCGWTAYTLSSPANIGKRFKIKFEWFAGGGPRGAISAANFVLGGPITFYAYAANSGTGFSAISFDDVQLGSSTITSGWYLSKAYDTGFTSSTIQITGFDYTANTSSPTFAVLTSTATNGVWSSLLTSSGTNAVGNRYVRFTSTISVGGSDSALSYISTFSVVAASSGTFYSAVKNAASLTAWSTFGANTILNGGTESFFIRASTNSFTVLSSTPAWTAQNVGGLVSVSTGTFFQVRDDFSLNAATQVVTLNDFTVNWFEGVATDQAYMLYYDNAIWQSVAFGSGQATNNYIFKYDLINDGWTLYNFGAGGLLATASNLYFGDTSSGNIFNYGTSTSDNGTAINAYWRSKSFTGPDPYLQNQLTNIDLFAKKNQNSTLTASYTIENSTATSYSVSLSTNTSAFIQSRKLLPPGKLGYTFDYKIGDTSASSAWEVLGIRIGYAQQPYRPAN